MGMFDTVYAELDCPYCGWEYRYSPLTWDDAEREIRKTKEWQFQSRQDFLSGKKNLFNLQDWWAERDGFDDIDVWISQLDAPEHIEAHRTRRHLGLAEIQTKKFECVMGDFYVGGEVPAYSGHYFIKESFLCPQCIQGHSKSEEKGEDKCEETVYVSVWLEIEQRRLKAVLVRDPDTNEPEREIFSHPTLEPLPPVKNPPIHLKYRQFQALARYDDQTEKYEAEFTSFPEKITFEGSGEEVLLIIFQSLVDDYLTLIGKDPREGKSLHEHLHSLCQHMQTDFEPYGNRPRTGPDCSCGCLHFLKLPGKLGLDWGVCIHLVSPRAGLLTFEHQGCEQFEALSGLENGI